MKTNRIIKDFCFRENRPTVAMVTISKLNLTTFFHAGTLKKPTENFQKALGSAYLADVLTIKPCQLSGYKGLLYFHCRTLIKVTSFSVIFRFLSGSG